MEQKHECWVQMTDLSGWFPNTSSSFFCPINPSSDTFWTHKRLKGSNHRLSSSFPPQFLQNNWKTAMTGCFFWLLLHRMLLICFGNKYSINIPATLCYWQNRGLFCKSLFQSKLTLLNFKILVHLCKRFYSEILFQS